MVCGLGEEALKASVKIYQWTLFFFGAEESGIP